MHLCLYTDIYIYTDIHTYIFLYVHVYARQAFSALVMAWGQYPSPTRPGGSEDADVREPRGAPPGGGTWVDLQLMLRSLQGPI